MFQMSTEDESDVNRTMGQSNVNIRLATIRGLREKERAREREREEHLEDKVASICNMVTVET